MRPRKKVARPAGKQNAPSNYRTRRHNTARPKLSTPAPSRQKARSKNQHVRKSSDRELLARYKVHLLPITEIKPSPENDELYGAIDHVNDPGLQVLVRSIKRLGLEEPLILTGDRFILSCHRRFVAVQELGWGKVPVRFAKIWRRDVNDYHRLLAEYNPQRVKSVASTLAETLLDREEADDSRPLTEYLERRSEVRADFQKVEGFKDDPEIGGRKAELLEAAIEVINSLRQFWPLTIRQIHYQLLNDPPLTQVTRRRNERWRYRNDMGSYRRLSHLLVAARYLEHVPWESINDDTRRSTEWRTFQNVGDFIRDQTENFLRGYSLDRQIGQPHHVEVILEKNTLMNVCKDICMRLHVPLTALRGYGGPSVWRSIENRYRRHFDAAGKAADAELILVFVSDHDPEGFNLMDDCARSLEYRHNIPVKIVRAAVSREQVEQTGAHPNPAKETSSRFKEYVERTGATDTWECEALPPQMLHRTLHDTLISLMDVEQLNAIQERERTEREQIAAIRSRLGTQIQRMIQEGGV